MRPGAEQDVRDLYEGTYARLVSVVAVAAGSRADAEEVVQEAFVRLLRHWPTVSRYDDPEAWVRQVAFRLLSNRLRKTRSGVRAVLRRGRPADAEAPTEDRLDVELALRALPVPQRQVLVLHHLVGL